MFSAELKVNGAIVSLITGVRSAPAGDDEEYVYDYELYRPFRGEVVRGHVIHRYEDGIERLIALIIEDALTGSH